MDQKTLEYIIAIAEEKSLSRAADRLFITQSALSQQLQKLKKQGLPPLFQEHKRKMLLTDAGKIYLNGAREILRMEARAREKLRQLSAESPKPLRIFSDPCLEDTFCIHILPELEASLPEAQVRLVRTGVNDARAALNRHALELLYIPDIYQQDDLYHHQRITRDELVLVSPAASDSSCLPLALPEESSLFRELCQRALSENGILRELYVELNHFHTILSLVSQGRCCALLPKGSVQGSSCLVQSLPQPYYFDLICVSQKGWRPDILDKVSALAASGGILQSV